MSLRTTAIAKRILEATGMALLKDNDETQTAILPWDWAEYLPAYPPVVLDSFMDEIIMKKELWHVQDPNFFENQVRIARFMQYHSVYDSLLLCHEPGTGKSSVAIAVMDMLHQTGSPFVNGRTVFIGNNATILNNFKNEIKMRSRVCRELWEQLVQNIKDPEKRENRWNTVFNKLHIEFTTYYQFAKDIDKSFQAMLQWYNFSLIVMDECHHLCYHQTGTAGEKTYQAIHGFISRLQTRKLLCMSGTPMRDQPEEIAQLWNLILPLERQLPTGKLFLDEYFDIERYIRVADAGGEMAEQEIIIIGEEAKESAIEAPADQEEHFEQEEQLWQEGGEALGGLPSTDLPLYRWKPGVMDQLGAVLQGRLSFMKQSLTNVDIRYNGEVIPPMTSIPVYVDYMTDFQNHYYLEALQRDRSTGRGGEKTTTSLYNHSAQASLFVFPNGSYGEPGFTKFCSFDVRTTATAEPKLAAGLANTVPFTMRFKMEAWNKIPNLNFRTVLISRDVRVKIDFIRQFSCVYASFLQEFMRPENILKKAFVYSNLVTGSGIRLLALILRDVFQFDMITRVTPALQNGIPKDRFIFINDLVRTPDRDVQELIRYFNRPENIDGSFCRLVLITNKMKEGISLFHVQQIHIVTPSWNFADIAQAIARGLRARSHTGLRSPKVDIYLHTAMPKILPDSTIMETAPFSIDFQRYLRSEIKDRNMGLIYRFMMVTSWDCVFTHAYHMERVEKADNNSRECDYQDCSYRCWPWSSQDYAPITRQRSALDAGNIVAWYNDSIDETLGKLFRRFFRKNSVASFEDIYNYISASTGQRSDVRYPTRFETAFILSAWVMNKTILYSIYNTPMVIQYVHPFYFTCGYPQGLSGVMVDNVGLVYESAHPGYIKKQVSCEPTKIVPEDLLVTGEENPIVETTFDIARAMIDCTTTDQQTRLDNLRNRLYDLLRVQSPHLGVQFEELWSSILIPLLLESQATWDATGSPPSSESELPVLLRIVYTVMCGVRAVSSTGAVEATIFDNPQWWLLREDGIQGRHTLFESSPRALASPMEWRDDTTIPNPIVQPPPLGMGGAGAGARRKLLPKEEMTEADMAKYIFDNTVGFYAFVKTGTDRLYIRDVRNKDVYRTEDRKLIPQGKDCTSFRAGDLAYIYLSIARHIGLGAPDDDEHLARFRHIINRYRTMPREALESAFSSCEGFPQFRQNYPPGTPLADIFSSLSDHELRRLLVFLQLKRQTDQCPLLATLFRTINLFKQ